MLLMENINDHNPFISKRENAFIYIRIYEAEEF